MDPELQAYSLEFDAIRRDAERLLQGLTEPHITWRERRNEWSVADCLNHLVATGNHSLSGIRRAIVDARSRGLLASGPFSHGMLGNWFVRAMDAPARIKFSVPAAYRPASTASVPEVVADFFRLQVLLQDALEEADGVDLACVKVINPVTSWFTLSLGQEFAFTAAHERRHLWQAGRARERLLRHTTP